MGGHLRLHFNWLKLKRVAGSVPQSHTPHFKGSVAVGGQWPPHWTLWITEHFRHQQEQVLDSTESGHTALASDSSLSCASCVAL